MKRTLSVLAFAVALAVTGALPAQAAMKKLRFGASFSGLHHPAYAIVAKNMRSEAKKLGVDILITDSQDKLAKQINDLEDMITKGVDVLFVNTVSKGTEPTLRKAAAKGIKVVRRPALEQRPRRGALRRHRQQGDGPHRRRVGGQTDEGQGQPCRDVGHPRSRLFG